MRLLRVNLLEILCLQSFDILTSGEHRWPLTWTNGGNPPVWDRSVIPFLRESICNLFTIWHMVTQHDLSPPTNTIENIKSIWAICMPSMKLLRVILLGYCAYKVLIRLLISGNPKITFGMYQNDSYRILNMGNERAIMRLITVTLLKIEQFNKHFPSLFSNWPLMTQTTFDLCKPQKVSSTK